MLKQIADLQRSFTELTTMISSRAPRRKTANPPSLRARSTYMPRWTNCTPPRRSSETGHRSQLDATHRSTYPPSVVYASPAKDKLYSEGTSPSSIDAVVDGRNKTFWKRRSADARRALRATQQTLFNGGSPSSSANAVVAAFLPSVAESSTPSKEVVQPVKQKKKVRFAPGTSPVSRITKERSFDHTEIADNRESRVKSQLYSSKPKPKHVAVADEGEVHPRRPRKRLRS
uniref:Uncharacterized protein n=1 Tax=Grammatophora oceanica TaxID=210454 RepID=A0A7S1VU72_9STRA|mmetsp:Transcript_7352/g.10789  ORF Transcript_7352/g.10789 Transcript_7352/m.10789 type:complete len:230 (+) Transcript_7352:297-986(+)